jgi:hypothetical protein
MPKTTRMLEQLPFKPAWKSDFLRRWEENRISEGAKGQAIDIVWATHSLIYSLRQSELRAILTLNRMLGVSDHRFPQSEEEIDEYIERELETGSGTLYFQIIDIAEEALRHL